MGLWCPSHCWSPQTTDQPSAVLMFSMLYDWTSCGTNSQVAYDVNSLKDIYIYFLGQYAAVEDIYSLCMVCMGLTNWHLISEHHLRIQEPLSNSVLTQRKCANLAADWLALLNTQPRDHKPQIWNVEQRGFSFNIVMKNKIPIHPAKYSLCTIFYLRHS